MLRNKLKFWIIIGGIFIAVVVAVFLLSSRQKLSGELNIYNWRDYLAPEVATDFEKEYGVKINIYPYDDEFIMLEELESDPKSDKYDLVVASDAILGKLIEQNLLADIDERNAPNVKHIGKKFMEISFNVKEFYAVPYTWGTTGMLVNTKFIPNADSWGVLWDQKYAGKIGMLNDPAEVVAAAAKYSGLPLVPQSEQQMKQVKQKLLLQKEIIAGYFEYTAMAEDMISEKLWAAHQWNGTAASAIEKNPDLAYIIPKEGAPIWMDAMAIPKNAKNKFTAETFLNYLNRPEVSAKNVEYLLYASCNEAAKKFISQDILNNRIIYPSKEDMEHLDLVVDYVADDEIFKMRNEIWDELNGK